MGADPSPLFHRQASVNIPCFCPHLKGGGFTKKSLLVMFYPACSGLPPFCRRLKKVWNKDCFSREADKCETKWTYLPRADPHSSHLLCPSLVQCVLPPSVDSHYTKLWVWVDLSRYISWTNGKGHHIYAIFWPMLGIFYLIKDSLLPHCWTVRTWRGTWGTRGQNPCL